MKIDRGVGCVVGEKWGDDRREESDAVGEVVFAERAAAGFDVEEPVVGEEPAGVGEAIDDFVGGFGARFGASFGDGRDAGGCALEIAAEEGGHVGPASAVCGGPAACETGIALSERDLLAVEEPVFPEEAEVLGDQTFEVWPADAAGVVDDQPRLPGEVEAGEEFEHDIFLVFEVVVEIADADAELGGEVVGRHRVAAALVEEPEGEGEDSIGC